MCNQFVDLLTASPRRFLRGCHRCSSPRPVQMPLPQAIRILTALSRWEKLSERNKRYSVNSCSTVCVKSFPGGHPAAACRVEPAQDVQERGFAAPRWPRRTMSSPGNSSKSTQRRASTFTSLISNTFVGLRTRNTGVTGNVVSILAAIVVSPVNAPESSTCVTSKYSRTGNVCIKKIAPTDLIRRSAER